MPAGLRAGVLENCPASGRLFIGSGAGQGARQEPQDGYLTPDYTFGHTIYASMKQFTEQQGWTTAIQQLAPLGTTDFSSYLPYDPLHRLPFD